MPRQKDIINQLLVHSRAFTSLLEQLVKEDELQDYDASPKMTGGKIMDIRKRITDLLALHPNLTSAQIADALYSEELGITPDLFKRRVIVLLSNMHKRSAILKATKVGTAKELLWSLTALGKEKQDKSHVL